MAQQHEISNDDRRVQPRHPVLARANVQIPGLSLLMGQAVDVSIGGLGLVSPRAVEMDQILVVNLPLRVCGESHSVYIAGRVRYCSKQSENAFRVGLQFVNIDPQTAQFIKAVCA